MLEYKYLKEQLKQEELNEELLLEMSNIASRRTGLSSIVWLDDAASERSIQHLKYRFKYGNNIHSAVSVTFYDNPVTSKNIVGSPKEAGIKDISKAIKWANLNRNILIKYYDTANHNEYDLSDFIDEMIPV